MIYFNSTLYDTDIMLLFFSAATADNVQKIFIQVEESFLL